MNAKEILRQYIIQKSGYEPDNLDSVLACFQEIKTKKNEVLIEHGRVFQYCYFIVSGCLKLTTFNGKNEEVTTDLAFEEEWRTSVDSFMNATPAQERLVSVEPSRLLAIHRDAFQKLTATVPQFARFYQTLLQQSYQQSQERVQTLMSMDALARLQWLLKVQPLIFTRLSNKLIASYLNISPATLSRLKAKL